MTLKRALERLFNLTRDFQPAFETVALLCEKQGDVQGAMNHYVSLAGHYLAARKPEKVALGNGSLPPFGPSQRGARG